MTTWIFVVEDISTGQCRFYQTVKDVINFLLGLDISRFKIHVFHKSFEVDQIPVCLNSLESLLRNDFHRKVL